VITARCDFARCAEIQGNIFNYELHRKPAEYSRLVELEAAPTP